jgi:hypothetical protein
MPVYLPIALLYFLIPNSRKALIALLHLLSVHQLQEYNRRKLPSIAQTTIVSGMVAISAGNSTLFFYE